MTTFLATVLSLSPMGGLKEVRAIRAKFKTIQRLFIICFIHETKVGCHDNMFR